MRGRVPDWVCQEETRSQACWHWWSLLSFAAAMMHQSTGAEQPIINFCQAGAAILIGGHVYFSFNTATFQLPRIPPKQQIRQGPSGPLQTLQSPSMSQDQMGSVLRSLQQMHHYHWFDDGCSLRAVNVAVIERHGSLPFLMGKWGEV